MSAGINPCGAPDSLERPGRRRGGSRRGPQPGLGGPQGRAHVESPAQRGSGGKGQTITIAPESLSCCFALGMLGQGENGAVQPPREFGGSEGGDQAWHSHCGPGDT